MRASGSFAELCSRLCFCFGLAPLVFLAACSDPSAGAASELGEGVQRLYEAPALGSTEGLDPASLESIQSSIAHLERDLERPEAWARLGVVLHAHRRFELARTCYQQALLRGSNAARSWYLLALVNASFGATERAERQLERCIALEPSYPPAHWRLGMLRLGRGELDGAEACMRAALAIAPEDAAAVVGLARVKLQQGDGEAAVGLLEEHTRRLPEDLNARFLLGTAYRKVGRMEDAERALATGGAEPIQNDPWQAEMQSHLRGYRTEFLNAVHRLEQGDVEGALERLETLHEREPEDTLVHLALHRAYRMQGELDRAIELLLDARSIKPLQDMVHLHLAGAYLERAHKSGEAPDPRQLQLARQSAERACQLSPTFAEAHGMLGDVLSALERPAEATDAYLQAAQLDASSIQWHERAARGLTDAERWTEALPILRRLDLLQPDSARTLYFLGVALAEQGRLRQAETALERASRLAPANQGFRSALKQVRAALASALRQTTAGGGDG